MKNTLGKSLVLLLTAVTIFSLRPTSLMADKPDTVVKPDKPPKEDKPPNPNKPPNPKKNTPPVADAGTDQNVLTGAIVTLDGSNSSDVNGNELTYNWSFTSIPEGSNASLSSTTVEKPTFSPDINGTYIISLIVNDGIVDSNADTIAVTATNIAGILDPTFSTDGIAIHSGAAEGYLDLNDHGLDITRDNSGNIYVTGYSFSIISSYDMVIWKYTSSGILDTTFGTNGFVTHAGAAGASVGYDMGNSIVLDSEGNIYVAGYSTNNDGNYDMAIWKYTSGGVLDTTFGTNGVVTHNSAAGGNDIDVATGIVINCEGSIYVTGYSQNIDNNNDIVIWKYTSTGSLDTTFDSDGIMIINDISFIGSNDFATAITLDSTDNIYVTGSSYGRMVILKLNNNGIFDTSFHFDGIVYNYISGNTIGSDIVVNDQGSIFVVGYSGNLKEDYTEIHIWKYTIEGSLDLSFSTDGIATFGDVTRENDVGYGITLDSLGNVYVTGYTNGHYNVFDEDMFILKYTNSGNQDSTFGNNGIVIHNNAAGGDGPDVGRAITIDNEGKIYVTGYSRSSDAGDNMVIWKYK